MKNSLRTLVILAMLVAIGTAVMALALFAELPADQSAGLSTRRLALVLFSSATVVSGLIVSLRICFILRHLRRLADETVAATREITGAEVTVRGGDELQSLIAAFGQMVQAVKNYQARAAIDADVLRRRENEWRNLVQNSPMTIIKVDRNLTIRFANRLPGGEGAVAWTGSSVLELVAHQDRELYLDLLTRAFAGRETAQAELRLYDAERSARWHQVTISAIGTDGRVCEVLQISHEVYR